MSSFLFVAGAFGALLFLLAYVRSGRFGTTVLAFGVGYLLSLMWTDILAAHQLVSQPFLSWRDTVYVVLILVPAVLALLFSHKQKSLVPRFVASLAIAALGVVMLLPVFSVWSAGDTLYATIEDNQGLFMTALLLLGLFDMVFSRLPKASRHKEH